MNIITQPNQYSGAYSAIPLQVYEENVLDNENFKYLINLTYDKVTITGSTGVVLNGNLYTKLYSDNNHSFKTGDKVFLSSDITSYSDFYNVQKIENGNELIINLTLSAPITGTTTVAKVIPFKMLKRENGEARTLINPVLKDFVSENLIDTGDIYAGPDTVFGYDIEVGYESKYKFNFDDNGIFTGATTGFFATGLTESDISNIPFQVGDRIKIQQDTFEWAYDDNAFSGGDLSFTSTANHSFLSGQSITVTGQITNPEYNGVATVKSVTSNTLVVHKPFGDASPTEGGIIYGIPRPEYNTEATIIDIYYDVTYGVVIQTDLPFAGSSQPISGNITYADGRLTEQFNLSALTGNYVYNGKLDKDEYSINGFSKYIIDSTRSYTLNNFASILSDNNNPYRIEPSTKSFLLVHSHEPALYYGNYKWYDKDDVLIGETELTTDGSIYQDFYLPIGIEQLIGAEYAITTNAGSSITSIKDDITHYTVDIVNSGGTVMCNTIQFEINTDSSRFELFHLMWKDKRGSFISYPFKYISNESTEVERKNFYQTEGNWANDSFDYDSHGRGEKSFFTRSRDKYTLNTGWIEEFENELIKDLLTSPSVYVQLPTGELVGCQIANSEFKKHKDNQDYLTNYTLNIAVSQNENRY